LIVNVVILNEVKDLLAGNTLCTVILNAVKDLSGSTTVDRLGDLEMFHFVQHDRV
jgi:hypothetical protein